MSTRPLLPLRPWHAVGISMLRLKLIYVADSRFTTLRIWGVWVYRWEASVLWPRGHRYFWVSLLDCIKIVVLGRGRFLTRTTDYKPLLLPEILHTHWLLSAPFISCNSNTITPDHCASNTWNPVPWPQGDPAHTVRENASQGVRSWRVAGKRPHTAGETLPHTCRRRFWRRACALWWFCKFFAWWVESVSRLRTMPVMNERQKGY